MRTRKEIEGLINMKYVDFEAVKLPERLILEVLLDIRDLLTKHKQDGKRRRKTDKESAKRYYQTFIKTL